MFKLCLTGVSAFAGMLLLAGCVPAKELHRSAELSTNQLCQLPPNLWREVGSPANREALLGLPLPSTDVSVLDSFKPQADVQEAWFESGEGDRLQLCQYTSAQSCYDDGLLRRVEFRKLNSSWRVERAAIAIVCTD
ncbi:hypothetical protein [Blastomonas marina]|uniref:hypothetical protein n=1 Tax=Blastomonas marina TaxID=1867408 RepID=UPI0016670A4B|nr:hypothetical protein [Blastomonas marina]